jgi:hypothetical protein
MHAIKEMEISLRMRERQLVRASCILISAILSVSDKTCSFFELFFVSALSIKESTPNQKRDSFVRIRFSETIKIAVDFVLTVQL